jgi:hypothetical protein
VSNYDYGDQQRQRDAGIEAEERHVDNLEVLNSENYGGDNKQPYRGKVQPAHSATRLQMGDEECTV